ncbi:MAG: hypothetical protein H6R15_49 [Proteobacteria bacterium]|nr:hypothetical protein [Pseudomonadota bacterium]
MNTRHSALKFLLLDLISPQPKVAPRSISALDEEDWATLLDMAQQHRLCPLLHWQITRAHANLPIPQKVLHLLGQSFKHATLRALVVQRELLLVHRILDQAGIPYVALKGAYLAFHAYPQPGLRPLRDIDILVPESRVLEANQTLLDSGLSRNERYPGIPEVLLKTARHLPPLRSPSGQVSIELHAHLFNPNNLKNQQTDLCAPPQFWERSIRKTVAKQAIAYESPTDLLLHLIVHAVIDHQFNNGPLLLSDLAFLLDHESIDWPLFWTLAKQGGHTRCCILALKLTERYWGTKSPIWPDEQEPDDPEFPQMIDIAAQLMLQGMATRQDLSLANEIAKHSSAISKVVWLLRKAFPPQTVIASIYPVLPNSPWVYFWYPLRWWRLAVKRWPEYLRSKQNAYFPHEAQQLADLKRWLTPAESP